jgi:hypothetical protein
MNTPKLAALEKKLARKPLREAFNKIKANPMPAKLRAALKAIKHCRDNETARAFFIWRLRALSATKNSQINALKTRPNIVDGIMKLQNVENRGPRHALRAINKRAVAKRLIRATVRQLALVVKKGLLGRFKDWQDRAGLLK